MRSWRSHVSEDTIIMLDHLKELYDEQQKIDRKQRLCLYILLGFGALLLIYAIFYIFFIDEAFFRAIGSFLKNIFHILLIVLLVVIFFVQVYFQSQLDAILEQFEALRHESIDHLKGSWLKNDETYIRDLMSKEMESYGINIRYKNSY